MTSSAVYILPETGERRSVRVQGMPPMAAVDREGRVWRLVRWPV